MNTLLIILAYLCLLTGLVAVFLPVPPAVPVAWLGLLLAHFAHLPVGTSLLVWAAAVGVLLMVLDYVVPLLATRHFGGTRWGVWGCTAGLLVALLGLPIGPGGLIGLFFWPLAGAFVGECLKQRALGPALRSAWGAFLGMLTGTLAKVAYALVLIVVVTVKLL